jgi:methyl-accepting chemotaxis protein
MTRLKVKTRITGGFLLVLALLLAVAVVGNVALERGVVSFDSYADESADAVRFATIDRNVAELRRAVTQFANTGSQDAFDRITEVRSILDKSIAEASAAAKSAEEKSGVEKMASAYATYSEYVDKVAALRADRDSTYNDQFVPQGDKARANLAEIIRTGSADGDGEAVALAGAAQQALLAAQLDALRFLNTPDRDIGDQAQSQIEAFGKASERLAARVDHPRRKALAAEVQAIAPKYLADFRALQVSVLETHVLITIIMPQEAASFAEATAETRQRQMAALDALMTATDEELVGAERVLMGVSAVALGIGLLLAWLIGNGIARPVVGMTETMTKLAAGDKSVMVPALGNQDEIGEMAKAVQVFKDNAIAVERMQAEQERAKLQAEQDRKAAMHRMADEFEADVKDVVEGVASASTEMQATADAMAHTASETSEQSVAVAAAAEQASSNVETVAAAAEEQSA